MFNVLSEGTMHLPEFEYLEPKTLKKAAKTLAEDMKGSVLIAGGTDLLVNMKHRVIKPNADLHRLPCLQTEDGWNSFEASVGAIAECGMMIAEFRSRPRLYSEIRNPKSKI